MEDHLQPYLPRVATEQLSHLSFCDAKPSALQHWLDSLPKVQLGETAAHLYTALSEISHLQFKPTLKIQMIAQVLEPMQSLQDSVIRKYLMGQSTDEQSLRRATLMLHRLNQYAIAAILDNLEYSNKPKDGEKLALACVFERLHHDLLVYQLCHQHPHPGLWQCFNKLMHHSLELNWLELRLPLQFTAGSLAHIAAAIVLQASCQPNQCIKTELMIVYELSRQWRQHALWRHPRAPGQSNLIVRPQTNLAPLSRRQTRAMWTEQQLGLDTRLLSQHLKQQMDNPSEQHNGLTAHLLAHLIQSWSGRPPRSHDRQPVDNDLLFCWGIKGIQHRIGTPEVLEKLFIQPSKPLVNTQSSPRDVWESIYHVDLPSAPSAAPTTALHGPEFLPAKMTNISPKGCGVLLAEIDKGVEVGELAAVRQTANDWHLGIIRWIDRGLQHQLGIELLAPHARACAIRLWHKNGKHGPYNRAILTNVRANDQQIETLVTPRLPFKSGDFILITLGDSEQRYHLELRITGSSRISLFRLQAASSSTLRAVSGNATLKEDTDSFWKLI